MNRAQLSGVIATPPVVIDTGKNIYFMLKVRHPAALGDSGIGVSYIPCGVFEPTARQREILLGKRPQNLRVEAHGRLEEIVMRDPTGRKSINLGMLVDPNGLLLQRTKSPKRGDRKVQP